jgi:hypothetical protein
VDPPSNIDIYFYYCLILILISHHKDFFNSLLIYIYIYIYIYILLIIYIVDLPVVRLRSCRVIYYFDTPALGIRHQLFNHVTWLGLLFFFIFYFFLLSIQSFNIGFLLTFYKFYPSEFS